MVHLDYDNDGDQDIVIFNNEGRPALLRNNAIHPGRPAAGGWLRVFLDTSGDPAAAPSGFGARVVVTALQDRPRPRCGSPPRLAPFHDVLAHGVAAHPQIAGDLLNRPPFVVPLVSDNVDPIHPQHPSLRSSSMLSNTKLPTGGLLPGVGQILSGEWLTF